MRKAIRILVLLCFDAISMFLAFLGALFIVNTSFYTFMANEWYYLVIALCLSFIFNASFKLYTELLKYMDFNDALKIIVSGSLTIIVFIVSSLISELLKFEWAVSASLIYLPLLGGSRFVYRIYSAIVRSAHYSVESKSAKRIMVIGAGYAGSALIREMKSSDKINLLPVCVLDDDKNKIGGDISGVKIVGEIKDAVKYAKEYKVDEIIISIPSLGKSKIKEIIDNCRDSGCAIKTVPGVYQLAGGMVSVSDIKEVSINDLLGREQVKVNLSEIVGYLNDKVVLVTGGGGSIGSELCVQIAKAGPKQLIIVDIYENNAYEIQQKLKRDMPELNLLVLIASVRDSKRVNNIFEKYKPNIVFHAAAHKHVPLMEESPNEAIKNNVSGTFKVADAAGRNGVERFILISTDKAVNPTNIMGASKRVCEMIVQTMDKRYETTYMAVRFGNVLGSNGSVIPLFREQIKEGGPVTVTHKDIVRYFMTIPEAVSLVLQAGAYAKGGEIFVLDMGEEVRIYDLAINMIKLSGLRPFKDIDIKITGLRPGEKLYEERLMAEEGLKKTANEMISIGKPLDIDEKMLYDKIQELYVEAYNETDKMKELVKELVPTYVIDKRN